MEDWQLEASERGNDTRLLKGKTPSYKKCRNAKGEKRKQRIL